VFRRDESTLSAYRGNWMLAVFEPSRERKPTVRARIPPAAQQGKED
jgi:hypothetical protein